MPAALNRLLIWLKVNKILTLILLGAFLASLFYSFHFQIRPAVDARAYDVIAKNIASGQGYREDLGKDLAHDYAIARIGPLYQYFLAGIYKIFGHDWRPVWVFQALLHSASAWLIYLTALLIFCGSDSRRKIALWAAAIIGFYPDLIEISAMLMSETLYLFLLCLVLYLFFRYFYKKNILSLSVLALVLGLAVLARPPVLFFIPIIIFYLYQKKLWRQAVLFLIIIAAVFTPWTIRNYIVYDKFMPFGAAGNFNFWIGNYHGSSGEQEPTQEQQQFTSTHGVREINSESMKQFKSFLRGHPGEFIKLILLRINKYFSVLRPMGFWFYQKGLGQLLFILSSALASVVLFILGTGGAIKAVKSRSEPLYYLLALTVFTPLIIFVTVVETRYRFQIYPLLAIFAGYFAVGLLEQGKWWRQRILWVSLAIFAVDGLIDLFLSLEKVKDKLNLFF